MGVVAVAIVGLTVGCGDGSTSSAEAGAAPVPGETVAVAEAWSRPPLAGQTVAAVYAVVSTTSDVDVTIVGASSPQTTDVELHRTVANDDGTVSMAEVAEGFVVPAGGAFRFEPGGPHIMLLGVDPGTYPADEVEVTLELDQGDPVTFAAEVRPITDGDGHDHGDHMSDGGDMSNDDEGHGEHGS